MRILWVKSGPLYPLNTGGRKRTHAMLVELSRSHEVTYLAFVSGDEPLSPEEKAADYASRKRWLPLREPRRQSAAFYLSLLKNVLASRLPWALEKWVDPSMTHAIEEECRESDYDLVVCDFLYPAPNALDADVVVPMVLFQHNMESQIWERMAANKSHPVVRAYFRSQFRRMFHAEDRISRAFDGVITVSPEDTSFARDRYRLSNVLGDVPTGVDPRFFSPALATPSPRRIGFLGSMDWMPNIEAVHWFVGKILPLIHRENPAVEFVVIGRNPPPSICDLAVNDERIRVTGTVDDVRPHVTDCRALVVPLLSGGGTRIKILEAIALGVPVVSTAVGAEGLSLVNGEHLLLAETVEEIADACLRIVNDDQLHVELSERGRQRIVEEHGWAKATAIFLDHCRKVIPCPAKEPVPVIRSALICHRGDLLNEEGMARWLASFSDLRLIVRIEDPPDQFWKRLCAEKKRSGLFGLLDVLAFRIWFRLFRSPDEKRWEGEKLKTLRRRFPAVPESCRVLDVDSPNRDEVAAALEEEGIDFALARCKRILTRRIFTRPKYGVFVIHPGICPNYRNAHGCFWAVIREDHENVGATLLQVDAGIDTGPVLGYFRVEHDPLRESHLRIQNRVVLENLDTIADHILRRVAGELPPIDTIGRPSGTWGQPRLTTFLDWRQRCRHRSLPDR